MSRILSLFLASVFVLAAIPALASAPTPDEKTFDLPPDGIKTSDAKLAAVLKLHESSLGTIVHGALDHAIERWAFTGDGMQGTEDLERSGTDYRSHIVEGPFTQDYGQFNGVRWHHDENGYTSLTTGTDDESFAPLRTLDDLDDPKNDVSLAGEMPGTLPTYVVKVVRPQRHHPEWVYVDKATGRIARIEYGSGKRYYSHVYDDYRTTNGISEPWHVHDSDGRTAVDWDWTRASLDRTTQINPAHFAPAPNTPTIALGVANGIPLPARMFRGTYVVRLSVHGRGLDFLIDCASPETIIDRDVARELNLPTFGQTTEVDGDKIWYRTIIDDATVGPVRFKNLVVTARYFAYNASYENRVVGLLGYDFLAQTVLKFDYMNGTIDIIPHDQFSAKSIAASYVVPLTFDDGLPIVPAQMGTSVNTRIAVNNALPWTIAFGPLIDKNPKDFVDDPGVKRGTAVVPFADENNFGASASVWQTRVSHLRFGPFDYQQDLILATTFPFEIGGRSIDAMIGIDNLSYFDVYLDYPDNQMILKPNKRFFEVFHAN